METNRYYRIERQLKDRLNEFEWTTLNCTTSATQSSDTLKHLRNVETPIPYNYRVVVITENTEVLDW